MTRLLAVNREFYQAFAAAYAETRRRPQPGVLQALRRIAPEAGVLDLGCGSGLVAQALWQLGHRGRYAGVDASRPLLDVARRTAPNPGATFHLADFSHVGWSHGLPGSFDVALAFALLHHVPSAALRERFLAEARDCLAPGGLLMLSVWDFLQVRRWDRRLVPWSQIGLDEGDLETGDYLLDWRHRGRALRYVHRFTQPELEALAGAVGMRVVETFRSDGEGGQQGLYQVWAFG
jgi:SAM-dependent methyltransferase